MNKTILVILFFLISSSYSYSDYYKPGNSIGFIYITKKFPKLAQEIHVPRNTRLEIAENCAGPVSGYLFFPNCGFADQKCWDNTITIGGKAKRISIYDYVSIDYDGYCLKYYEMKNGYIKILEKTNTRGFWISIKYLEEKGFSIIDWKTFILKIMNKRIYFPIVELNLRSKPTITSTLLATMNANIYPKAFQIILTGNNKGLWAEVEVRECDYSRSTDDPKVIRIMRGWCKIFDDKGYLNIMYSPKE